MADAHDDSITLADLQSLSQAVSLYEKLCRVLSVVVTAGATRYATLAWPAPGDVRSAVEGELSFRGRFMLRVPTTNGRSHARLYLGAYTIDGPGLAIWVESDPRAGSQRRQIIDLANQQGLPAHWERQLASWQALLATPDLSDELTQEELVAWYLERIEELDRVGILRLMPTLTR